jgi:hypothetical protein
MTRRSSLRSGGKWLGTLACGLILALLLLSGRYRLYLTTRWGYGVEVMTGGATLHWSDPALPRPLRDPVLRARTWGLPDAYDMAGLFRWPRYWPPGIRCVQLGSDVTDVWYLDGYCSLPGWMVLLVAAAPTAWLWWPDRRRIPPGHCQGILHKQHAYRVNRIPALFVYPADLRGPAWPARLIKRVYHAAARAAQCGRRYGAPRRASGYH